VLLTCLALVVGAAIGAGCGGDEQPASTVPELPAESAKEVNDAIARILEEARIGANYDSLIDAATQSINGYWARTIPQVYNAQYEPPEISGGYDPDEHSVLCDGKDEAIEGNAFYCPSENFIAWEEPTFFFAFYTRIVLAPAFILAHEWGHAIQRQLGVGHETTVEGELEAGCLAGAWAQDAAQRGDLTREDFDRAVDTLIKLQDPEGVLWLDPGAHGTAFERNRAFGDGVVDGPAACIPPSAVN
jgi:predicted metalloprotease